MATLTHSYTQIRQTQFKNSTFYPLFSTKNLIFNSSIHSPLLNNTKPFIKSTNLQNPLLKHRTFANKVLSGLPLVAPERVSSPDKLPKWSEKAIRAFAMGELEARKLRYPTTGTEGLLMGLLIEGTNLGGQLLRANGITLSKVREEAIKLLGKGDMYFFSPEHPPLTESAQRALNWAVEEKLKSGVSGEITTTHLLLGVWSEKEAAGHKIMAALGFNDDKAKELEAMLSSKPGFIEP